MWVKRVCGLNAGDYVRFFVVGKPNLKVCFYSKNLGPDCSLGPSGDVDMGRRRLDMSESQNAQIKRLKRLHLTHREKKATLDLARLICKI